MHSRYICKTNDICTNCVFDHYDLKSFNLQANCIRTSMGCQKLLPWFVFKRVTIIATVTHTTFWNLLHNSIIVNSVMILLVTLCLFMQYVKILMVWVGMTKVLYDTETSFVVINQWNCFIYVHWMKVDYVNAFYFEIKARFRGWTQLPLA